ncbi:DUF2723 domain-containing protein [Flavobacterium sp. CS20]|uniref:DUF2723 domain-containing protein n=1 Tax=Flavobacterium sp. CS20 TaxID=2775246 RepID=UPI001B39F13C|nr:DUF2723 domain-containing protein [Flavobacterium sp. CS20]QTY26111.1 DUF2723 domain-containing protein [Flavobacterium sp. CS20]
MSGFNFSKWNKIVAWLAFAIALVTYSMTLEPTLSFWDAGEYIATSSKLQVGHPPGAPLYQMLGAVFSIFAPEASQIALMINFMSGLSAAFAVLFMFWSVVLLFRKIYPDLENATVSRQIMVLSVAFIGALSLTFSDSFWFNSVEAEVYAMASCIMSILFYVGLLWERDMHKPRGNRWLILISFIVGLSFGVHFMGLLTIPAIGYMYYFKNTKTITIKNFVVSSLIILGALMFIFKFLLPYSLTFFAKSELFFVNTVGLPFHSGTVIAGLVVIAFFIFALKFTRQKGYPVINSVVLSILFIFIGFSSWIMLPIRANAGTTINENNPSSAQALLAYYNRDQYPEVKLFYGPQFTDMFAGLDPDNPYSDEEPKYERDEELGKYVIVNDYKNAKQNPNSKHKTFLPRMWSFEHAKNYLAYTGPIEFTIKPDYQGSEELTQIVNQFRKDYDDGKIGAEGYISFLKDFAPYLDVEKPSAFANFSYMIEHQFMYMYWRYFMWNFAGRQNDIQGQGTDLNGNWISGINFIDEWRLGNQDELTTDMKTNKARNTYFFLPLILGIIGLLFHYQKDKKSFWILLVFFLFTSIALKIYLNERPFEPRERDYALVGSFYVYCMWIGFGVFSIYDSFRQYLSSKILVPLVSVVCLLVAPVLMASENWDDHDRSNRYSALTMAKKYLDSVDENAILFTIGDNDTFALWFAQEILGYRTDVRVVNTQLFATDWYIDQMRRKAYKSDPLKTYLEHEDYSYGTNEAVWFNENKNYPDTLDIDTWIKFIKLDDKRTKAELQSGQWVNTFPTKHIRIPVNKKNAINSGIVKAKDLDKIVDEIVIKIPGSLVYKHRLLMLDVLANTEWKRPIYFTGGSYDSADFLWMKDYLQLDGVCYKLVPIKTDFNPKTDVDMGRIDTEKMYDIVMNWDWKNSGKDNIYYDTETRRNSITYRSNMARLADSLAKEKKYEKAENVLDLAMEKMPVKYFGYYTLLNPIIEVYYKIDKTEKARAIWQDVAKKYQEKLRYFSSLNYDRQSQLAEEISTEIQRYRSLVDMLIYVQDDEMMQKEAETFNSYLELFDYGNQLEETPSKEDLMNKLLNSGDSSQTDTIPEQPE